MTETEKQILKLVSSLKPEKAIESIERVQVFKAGKQHQD
jgi:hypothetical protein